MPIKKNAKKALRQAKKRAEQNAIFRRAYKQAVKVTGRAVASGTGDLRELARLAQKTLDKAAKRGVIKKKTAGRKLSRLMKKLNAPKSDAAK